MDKYETKAHCMIAAYGVISSSIIAQALRQSAAEAFEEAAKDACDETWERGCMDCTSTSDLEIKYGIKAAALRKEKI